MRKSACIEVTGELDLYSLKRPLQPMPTGVVVGNASTERFASEAVGQVTWPVPKLKELDQSNAIGKGTTQLSAEPNKPRAAAFCIVLLLPPSDKFLPAIATHSGLSSRPRAYFFGMDRLLRPCSNLQGWSTTQECAQFLDRRSSSRSQRDRACSSDSA